MSEHTQSSHGVRAGHGRILGGLVVAILLGAVTLNWAHRTFPGDGAGQVAGQNGGFATALALFCALAAAAAVWTLASRLADSARERG